MTDPSTLRGLREGKLEVVGRLPGSSNQALVVLVHHPDLAEPFHAVYKATVAERPLFDFPVGTLARREVAAFLVSEATGWGLVPSTVLRDGPYGVGMVQQWIHGDPSVDLVALVVEDDPRLRRMAVFDAIVNNTDRKGGHLVPMPDGHVFGVDHGVTFSVEPKLRTVLWGWIGTPFEDDELAGLQRVRDGLRNELAASLGELLDPAEVTATKRRVAALLRSRHFPRPNADWPSIPWPPF
ncbi:MAG: phosphatidylinositol kinase [Chloroflexi bacterium RBG_16_70_13]|nr:MAG: phosphatidylinositol kinase [Chloroflexi bacterium RBG_16_70_13]